MNKDIFWWVAIAVYFTSLFWLTDLDIVVSSLFVENGTWKWEDSLFALFFYNSVPVLVSVTLIGSLLATIWFWYKKKPRYRNYAIYFLLVIIIGPGLIVNSLFKDNWGRPRPSHTIELTGTEAYVKPLIYNAGGKGKSFPSGHASAAFSLFALWFLAAPGRRNRRILFSVTLYGGLVGLSRMMQGGHYLSDVLWAGLICYATAWLLARWIIVPTNSAEMK